MSRFAIFGLSASALGLAALAACSRESSAGGSGSRPVHAGPNAAESSSLPAAERPDILFISIDSMRADHVGCYGYAKPTTPNIDSIARDGVRCMQAVSTTSWTLPAHTALFTGLFDSTHGVVDNGLALSPKIRTLAEVVRDAGWNTAGFYGGPYLHPVFGLSQGFESWQSCMGISETRTAEQQVADVLDPFANESHSDVTGPRTAEAVAKYLGEAKSDKPLFMFVHLWDVHYDYRPPEEYWRRFDPNYQGSLDARNLPTNAAIHPKMVRADFDHLVALYDGEIAFTDDIVGRILDSWKAHRDLDRTLIVIDSDHGEEFFDHNDKGHQHTLFEEVLRVPLIFRWPGHFEGGRTVDPLVSLVDVMPTMARAVGARETLRVQGRDIGPLLHGESMEPVPALCELLVDGGDLRALRTEKLKVLSFQGGKYRFAIDLARDPKEVRPLPQGSAELETGLEQLRVMLGKARDFARELDAPPTHIVPDRAIEHALQGLGYSGDGDEAPTKPR